jgi:hypothetical protein
MMAKLVQTNGKNIEWFQMLCIAIICDSMLMMFYVKNHYAEKKFILFELDQYVGDS